MDERRERRLAASIVRAVLLAVLGLVVVPAIITVGNVFAVPAVALMLLAASVVAILGLTFWLATVGAPARWLGYRLRLTPDGFLIGAASVAALSSAIGLVWFRFEVERPHSALAEFDLRAASTAARLAGELDLMRTLNSAGIRSMLVLGGMFVLAAVAVGAFRSAVVLAATIATGAVLVEFLKMNPERPLSTLGDFSTGGNTSWPSGHAALQGSIALGLILWWWAAGLPRPSIVAAVLVPLAALVGYSRAYLGIHYLSEVLSGWLVATVAASVVLAADRLVVPRLTVPAPTRRWPVLAAGLAALTITSFAVPSVRRFHDRGPRRYFPGFEQGASTGFRPSLAPSEDVPTVGTSIAANDPAGLLGPLPRYSETLLGAHVQPIGLVVVASADELRAGFQRAGFSDAAPLTPKHLPSAFWAGITGGDDAPIAATFYDTRSAALVAQRPGTDGAATQQAEVWQVPAVTASGCSIWAVTTSLYDRDVWKWRALFPARHIDPAVDTQRDQLARALASPDRLEDLGRFGFVAPTHGTAPGGSYVTDGKVAVLRQPGCDSRDAQ